MGRSRGIPGEPGDVKVERPFLRSVETRLEGSLKLRPALCVGIYPGRRLQEGIKRCRRRMRGGRVVQRGFEKEVGRRVGR